MTVQSVFSGNVVAGDPCVVRTPDGFRMSYTDADLDPLSHPIIGTAVSQDGLNWTPLESPDPDPGIVLRGRSSDEAVETSCIFQTGPESWLLYVTTYYTPVGNYEVPGYFIPAEMYLLISDDDGKSYTWWPAPVIGNEPGYTKDGAYAPSIVRDGHLVMAFNAFNYDLAGGYVLIAESQDGINWTNRLAPAISPGGPEWMRREVKNPSLVKHGDTYLLFFMGDDILKRTSIGMAHSQSLSGPWTIREEPILNPEPGTSYSYQVLAPSVLIEGDDVRMWFMGASDPDTFTVHHTRIPLAELL